jgi:hypothetical protein
VFATRVATSLAWSAWLHPATVAGDGILDLIGSLITATPFTKYT